MNGHGPQELPITARVNERPTFSAARLRSVKPRHLIVRFVAGALTSMVAEGLTLALGPRVGEIMLAFPAILAASLTLIEEEQDSALAREDARGATIGGVAMAVFAAIVAVALPSVNGAVTLGLAMVGWLVVALGGYGVFWFR